MIDNKKLKEIYRKIDLNDLQKKHYSQKIPSDIMNIYKDSYFCWNIVNDYAASCNNYLFLKSHNITLHIYYIDNINIPFVKLCNVLKNCIALTKYLNMQRMFDSYIVLYPEKRFLPLKNEIMNCKNINGGFTFLKSDKIFIFREEELSKTILHEILHHCNAIHIDEYNQMNIRRLKECFNISNQTKLLPNEAVVEFFTTIFHSMFVSYETQIPYQIILNLEKQHSIKQSNKIKHLQGTDEWYEKTNAYCYIIFKTILLLNNEKFLSKYELDDEFITSFIIENNKIPYTNVNKTDKSLRMTLFG